MPNPVALDFRRPPYLSRRQLQTIRQAQEEFAKNLSANLSAYFRIGVEATIVSLELMTYAEFAENVGSSACWAGLWLPSEAARAVLQLESGLVSPLLELVLGGDHRIGERIDRELTELELNLLEGVIRVILREWKESWKRLIPLEFLLEAVQSSNSIQDLLPAGETVLASCVDFRIGDSTGKMNLAIPGLTVKNLRQRSDALQATVNPVPAPETDLNIWESLRSSVVTVEAQVAGPTTTIKFRDVLSLAVGQVLVMDFPIAKGVIGTANNSRCFEGHLARTGTKRALRIEALSAGKSQH